MVADSRWPAIPLLALRGIQLFFAVVCLGLSGFIVGQYPGYIIWSTNLTVATGVFTLIYCIINFVLFFIDLLLPLPIVIVDAFLLVLWLTSMAGLGELNTVLAFFSIQCSEFIYTVDQRDCGIIKADFSLSLFQFVLFIVSLVIASIVLHKNRKDLRGAKHNSGLTPDGEATDIENQGQGVVHEPVYYEEQKPAEYQQQQQQQYQQPTDAYYQQQQQQQQQQHIVSPPQTPAPYTQPQGYVGSPAPPPPPPPPVNAQEMPAYR